MISENEFFECKGCGNCCHGESTVSLDKADIERMVNHLGMPEKDVKTRYLRITGNVIQMQIVDHHCVFYDKGCTIHPGKPWRCSQWPLHPSILTDEANFSAISESCIGINKELGYDEFCKNLSIFLETKKGLLSR